MAIDCFLWMIILIFPILLPSSLKAQDISSDTPAETLISLDNSPKSSPKLKVGFAGEEPILIVSQTGQLTGISVQVWEEIAEKLELSYEVAGYSSVSEALDHLEKGKLDIVLGTVSVTPERLELLDFTQPLNEDDLTLLLPSSPPTLWSIVKPFVGWAFLSSAGLIYLCLFIVGNLLWLAEHKRNPQQFPPNYFKGIKEGMWCAVTTFTTVGYGDRYPITHLGRIIAGWWAILSVVIVTSLTAGIATTLALAFSDRTTEQFRRAEDLKNARIAALKGSNAQKWAAYYQARVILIKDLQSGVEALQKKQVDGILYSQLFLQNYLHNNPKEHYKIADFTIGTEYYSIALTQNNPLTRQLNEQILDINTQIQFKQIHDHWFQLKNANTNDDSFNNE